MIGVTAVIKKIADENSEAIDNVHSFSIGPKPKGKIEVGKSLNPDGTFDIDEFMRIMIDGAPGTGTGYKGLPR